MGPIPERIAFACGLVGRVWLKFVDGYANMELVLALRQGKATLGPLAEGLARGLTS